MSWKHWNPLRAPSVFFQSVNHVLRTVEIDKTCLNAFDDKRYILNDGVGTLTYGHFRIPGVVTSTWTLLRGDVYYTWIESLCMYCNLLYVSRYTWIVLYWLSHYTVCECILYTDWVLIHVLCFTVWIKYVATFWSIFHSFIIHTYTNTWIYKV